MSRSKWRACCESLGFDEEQRPCCLARVVLMGHSCDKGSRRLPDELLSDELSAACADGQIRAQSSDGGSDSLQSSRKSPACEGATPLNRWRKFSAEGSIPFEIKLHFLCKNLTMPQDFTSPPAKIKVFCTSLI
ncbi:hypothetical protein KOW79_013030 [Hemibagrus wyckioides]|uniref:Uncharacterized protein n=1 Tax=Hemibagrus wyckioides TaxID=337641 RepID=A0A9D3SKZ1_9TELE|nr:hypothetical protein KOW79_013030 [Hemibagrus wyckioides]